MLPHDVFWAWCVLAAQALLHHAPFWSSQQWRACLSSGEYLGMEPDYWAQVGARLCDIVTHITHIYSTSSSRVCHIPMWHMPNTHSHMHAKRQVWHPSYILPACLQGMNERVFDRTGPALAGPGNHMPGQLR